MGAVYSIMNKGLDDPVHNIVFYRSDFRVSVGGVLASRVERHLRRVLVHKIGHEFDRRIGALPLVMRTLIRTVEKEAKSKVAK